VSAEPWTRPWSVPALRVRPYGVGAWKLRVFFRHWDPGRAGLFQAADVRARPEAEEQPESAVAVEGQG
jgi:hypothetical protein